MKHFKLDAAQETQPLKRYWEHCVGSCHATTALRKDWQDMLAQCHRELGFRYVRFHGLLDDDMSIAFRPLFTTEVKLSFVNSDKIFDFLLSIGMKPFIELGFMPECLASGSKTVFHYKGNTTPPADYDRWEWFIGAFVRHLIDRYGREEVRQWFFEVWNEPNLGGPDSPYGFWAADMQEYFKLYQSTAAAVKAQDPFLRVGGPATSNNAWIPEMISFCRENKVPLDFISTHHYPTDIALGFGVEDSANFVQPPTAFTDPEVMQEMFASPDKMAELGEEYSVFRKDIWKNVDRGVLKGMTERVVQQAQGLPVYYTEWSSLAGLESDGPFGASFIPKTILDGRGLVEGYSYWTFSDIFEESGQESAAFHGGFGLMTTHGIPKAPYRAFQLLHRLGSEIYDAPMADGTIDVYGVRKAESGALQLLFVNHHSLLHPIEREPVSVSLTGFGGFLEAEVVRIDDDHANALQGWQRMGAPEYLNEEQVFRLKADACLHTEPLAVKADDKDLRVEIELPPMGIALTTLYFEK